MKRIKRVARTFDELSRAYDRWYFEGEGKLLRETEVRAVERMVPGGTGLEVGVGSGIFAPEVGAKFGVDPAESLLRKAHSRDIEVVLGIAEALPFKENTFDFLLFVVTLCFLSDPARAFSEAWRVLRTEGKLIVCFIPRRSPWGSHYRRKKAEGHEFYGHANFHRISEVRGFLKESGFELEDAVSTLFQGPGAVTSVEEPAAGMDGSAGFCCLRAMRD